LALSELEPFLNCTPVAPEMDSFYLTFNGSIVYILDTDTDGDACAVVLRGGHRLTVMAGEKKGERYALDSEGYYKIDGPNIGAEIGMSLLRKLPIDISDYGRPTLEDFEGEEPFAHEPLD
jgi:hypothetical protein